jgi:hypothetical protein
MRRLVLLIYIGLTLASLSGCHLCHKKHLAATCYSGCSPCGCDGGAIAGPIDVVPGPGHVVIASPPVGIPAPAGVGVPGPLAR